ncbi:hypothetical protein PTKIN_Ptkin13bG0037600 [Pterospermum kingtungense]
MTWASTNKKVVGETQMFMEEGQGIPGECIDILSALSRQTPLFTRAKTESVPVVQPPAVTVTQQPMPYNSHAIHASVGPVIAVLLVIIILGVVAGMIGRLCTGRRIMGYGQYDIESWIETKCSSCIDGRIYSPPTARANAVPPSIENQPHHESKQEDQTPTT